MPKGLGSENNTDNNTSADEDEFSSDSDTLKKTDHATFANKPQSQKKTVKSVLIMKWKFV